MKLMTKLVIIGSVVVATAAAATLVIIQRKRDRRRQDEDQDEGTAVQRDDSDDLGVASDLGDPGDELGEDIVVIATSSGMADVDPEPLAQTVGEGIALEPTEAAHTEIQELRERLPHPGKGI
jgi:hypothetical protein